MLEKTIKGNFLREFILGEVDYKRENKLTMSINKFYLPRQKEERILLFCHKCHT